MVDFNVLFNGLQQSMLADLNLSRSVIEHPGTKGDASEDRWIEFLRQYLPERYKVDKAIVIDSEGTLSLQIDIVVYDALYTPFIFNHDGTMFIPAEAVYAVFEVKQDIEGYIKYAAEHIESVRKLKRTSMKMVASGRPSQARQIPKIIGGILTTTCSIKQTSTIEQHLKELHGLQTIDLGCCVDFGSFFVDYENDNIPVPKLGEELTYEENNERLVNFYNNRIVRKIVFSEAEKSLFTFFLQLVHYMKTIGTAPAIDVNAYLRNIGQEIDIDF